MRDEQHYRRMLAGNPGASIGFTLAAAMVYAVRYGCIGAGDRGSEAFRRIALRLRSQYGEYLSNEEAGDEMDRAHVVPEEEDEN